MTRGTCPMWKPPKNRLYWVKAHQSTGYKKYVFSHIHTNTNLSTILYILMYSQGNCLTCFNDHENVQTVFATQWNQAIATAKHWWHCVNCASVNNWFLCSWSRWFIKVQNQAVNGHKQSDSSIIPRESLSCWDYPLSAERAEAIKIVWVNSLS